jgi:hypothetical protein
MCASRACAILLILWGNMKTGLRVLVAATLAAQALIASGAGAQDATSSTAPPSSGSSAPANQSVGPPQLRDFSLNGQVTRESTAPVSVKPAPKPSPPTAEEKPVAKPEPTPPTRQAVNAPTKAQPEGAKSAATTAKERTSADPAPIAIPKRALALKPQQKRLVADALPTFPQVSAPTTGNPAPASLDAQHRGPSYLLWILAAIAVGAGGGFLFYRHRPRRLAGFPLAFDLGGSAPPPATPRPEPEALPKPPPAAPAGIVSTRLRPWIELELMPGRVIVDQERAVVEFAISIFNSGSTPALDLLIEGSMFNAGPLQDQQIGLFFDNPVGQGQKIPALPPMQRIAVKSAVKMNREQFQALEIQGRPLLVPLVAFNALYRWGSGEGQTSTSYLVGRTTEGDKLAPFRLDLEPRVYRKLAAREHDLRVKT